MFVTGNLVNVNNLLIQAKINYFSKVANTINYIKLTKALAYLEHSKVKIPVSTILNNSIRALEIISNIRDFRITIKYISDKFNSLIKDKNKIRLHLTSNNMAVSKFINLLAKIEHTKEMDLTLKSIAKSHSNITVFMNINISSGNRSV